MARIADFRFDEATWKGARDMQRAEWKLLLEELIDDALPRAAQRASWWDTARAPEEKMPQREACLDAGFTATRMMDGKSVRFTKIKPRR